MPTFQIGPVLMFDPKTLDTTRTVVRSHLTLPSSSQLMSCNSHTQESTLKTRQKRSVSTRSPLASYSAGLLPRHMLICSCALYHGPGEHTHWLPTVVCVLTQNGRMGGPLNISHSLADHLQLGKGRGVQRGQDMRKRRDSKQKPYEKKKSLILKVNCL